MSGPGGRARAATTTGAYAQPRRGVSAAAKPGAQNGKTFGALFVPAKNVARCLAARRRVSPKLSVLTGCWLYDHRCRGRSAISFAQSSYQAIALELGDLLFYET